MRPPSTRTTDAAAPSAAGPGRADGSRTTSVDAAAGSRFAPMLLAVGNAAPDPRSPDPAERLLGHLLVDLARRTEVVVAAPEVPAGRPGALAGGGVAVHRLVDVGPELVEARPTGGRRPDAVVVLDVGDLTSLAVAEAVAGSGPLADVPVVAVVARSLASAELAASAGRPGAHHLDGLDQSVAALADRERLVLAGAVACCCATDGGAAQVEGLLGGGAGRTPVRVLDRPRPWPAVGATVEDRRTVVVPGRWHAEAGLADGDGLTALADELLGRPLPPAAERPGAGEALRHRVLPVGLDGAVGPLQAARRLAGRRGGANDLDRRSWGTALSAAAAVALVRRFGVPDLLVADDALAAGVPVLGLGTAGPAALAEAGPAVQVVADVAELVDAIDRRTGDVRHRVEALEAAVALADQRWPADRPRPSLADQVLDALGPVLDGSSAADGAAAGGEDGSSAAESAAAGGEDGPSAADATAVGTEDGSSAAVSAAVGTEDGSTPAGPAGATRAVRRPAGTLAAASGAAEAHERRTGLGWVTDRYHGLHAESLVDEDRRYELWRAAHEETPAELAAMARSDQLAWRPTVSLLVPCWRTPPELLDALVDSVRAQAYRHWQLCLVDDASGDDGLTAHLDRLAATDERIVVEHLDEPAGIAGATNAALALATGELVGLVDHDDELHPAALWRVVERWNLEPDLDVAYTDEDKLDEQGRRVEPAFKPDWDPDLLLELNYVNHLTVLRRSLVTDVGGWRPGLDGAQDLDLLLRVTERTDRVGHVARPLYHWRKVAGSTAAVADAKGDAGEAGRRALADALERRGLAGEIGPGVLPTWHHVRWHHDARPTVSIVVPTRDAGDLVRRCLDSVRATTEHPWELVLVDNASSDPASLAYFDELAAEGATIVRYPHEFHFARQVDLGVAAARSPLVLVLNNDTVAETDGWLEELVAQALRPEVGLVGLRLRFPDGVAQHEGIVLGVGGVAWNLNSAGVDEWGRVVRDCSAVTAAAVLARTSVLRAAGGVDQALRVAYNDVDLGLRVSALGWRVVYTPFAELRHAESATRGSLHPMEDEELYIWRWGGERALRDPFWNVNLDLLGARFLVI